MVFHSFGVSWPTCSASTVSQSRQAPWAADAAACSMQRRGKARSGGILAVAVLLTAFVQHHSLIGDLAGGDSCKSAEAAKLPITVATDEWDPPGCQPPAVNESSLAQHRCHIETDICIDQGRFVSWAKHWQPGETNLSGVPWRFANAPVQLPGHTDGLLGPFQVHYCQPQPRFQPVAAHALQREHPDIADPRFSRCTMPVIFWPYWHTNTYEVVSEALEPLWRMLPGGDGPPLLLDRRAKLVPGIDGYPLPDFYHWLLLPFSERKVEDLHELSARWHAVSTSRSRCFRRAMLCSIQNMISPPRGVSSQEHRKTMRPSKMMQQLAGFYRREYPQHFRHDPPKDVLEVLFIHRPHGSRRILNLGQVLRLCNAWLPEAGGFESARCRVIEFKDGAFLENLAMLQTAHILVGLHGAPLIFGLAMRPGSAIVELRPNSFEGYWPNNYSQTIFNIEKLVRFFYMHTSAINWQPGYHERHGPVQARDRDTIVDWTMLAKVLTDAASGRPGYEEVFVGHEAPHMEPP